MVQTAEPDSKIKTIKYPGAEAAAGNPHRYPPGERDMRQVWERCCCWWCWC